MLYLRSRDTKTAMRNAELPMPEDNVVDLPTSLDMLAEQIKQIETRMRRDLTELERTKQRFLEELAKRKLGIAMETPPEPNVS